MTVCSVIALLATQASGATGSPSRAVDNLSRQARESAASPRVAPVHCSARKAVKFYAGRIAYWRSKMGVAHIPMPAADGRCPRFLAHVLQHKARALRREYARWLEHEWHWQAWLPAKFYRVARCETGVRWDWDSGTYVSAFGIIRVAYEWYHHWTGHNSPREQYEVAAAIQQRFGWSAWGCGGA